MARPDDGLTQAPLPTQPAASPATGVSPLYSLENRLHLAQLALFWENFWPRLFPAGLVLGFFLVLAGFDIWRYTPVWLHWLLLGGFGLGLIAALWGGFRGYRLPDRAAALRRLETGNQLVHRPLGQLADSLAGPPGGQPDPIAEALWQAHRRRLLAQLGTLRILPPEAGWWRIDRFGLRVAVGLLLVVAWASPGEQASQRMRDALQPGTALPPGATLALDAWITPPLYTGRPPIFLSRDGKPVLPTPGAEPLSIPTGSLLKLRLQASQPIYGLKLGGQSHALKPLDEHNAEIDLPLDLAALGDNAMLALLRRDQPVAEWPLRLLADTAPKVAFAEEPKAVAPDRRQPQLEIALNGEDDYGVQKIELDIRHADSSESWLVDWPAPPVLAGGFSDKRPFDFVEHPLAGQQVALTLVATDALGQQGRSEPVITTLPARKFTHPVAKALIEQRRLLALKPGDWSRVTTALRALSLAPESYRQDTAVHLALRMGAARLSLNRSPEARGEVSNLLWQTALRLEDGKSNLAERDFQAAYDRLQDAIERGAEDNEIMRKMQELREAMDRLMEEKMREAMERLARGEELEELSEDDEAMSSEDFQDMMDQAEQMARQGDRQSAQDMLEQMQRMLEAMKNMRIGRAPQGQQGQQQRGQRGQRGSGQQMGELGEMLRQQQQLLDRSFRRSQQFGRNGQPGQPGQQGQPGQPGGDNEADARQQEDLRRRLGEMMNRFAERGMPIPEGLGRADRAMRDAREALRRGEPGEAMQGQNDALDQMRQGLRDLQQAQRGGEPGGQADAADSRQNQRNRDNRDPFGRPTGGIENPGESTRVPESGMTAIERARRILEELQRRAGDRDRPALERDYLERLLRRF